MVVVWLWVGDEGSPLDWVRWQMGRGSGKKDNYVLLSFHSMFYYLLHFLHLSHTAHTAYALPLLPSHPRYSR